MARLCDSVVDLHGLIPRVHVPVVVAGSIPVGGVHEAADLSLSLPLRNKYFKKILPPLKKIFPNLVEYHITVLICTSLIADDIIIHLLNRYLSVHPLLGTKDTKSTLVIKQMFFFHRSRE